MHVTSYDRGPPGVTASECGASEILACGGSNAKVLTAMDITGGTAAHAPLTTSESFFMMTAFRFAGLSAGEMGMR
jgi:hypothetical protein